MPRIELSVNSTSRAAVANALYRVDGVRHYARPMKDSPAARYITGEKTGASVPE